MSDKRLTCLVFAAVCFAEPFRNYCSRFFRSFWGIDRNWSFGKKVEKLDPPVMEDYTAPLCQRGNLSIRIGPMFSGKTTWLNEELCRLGALGVSVLKIVHSDDSRESLEKDSAGSTHNPCYTSLPVKITVVRCTSLENVDVSEYDVVGVDEAQFFGDLASVVASWVRTGKIVRVSGLDGDFSGNVFGETLKLIPICDEVLKLNAYCSECLKTSGKFVEAPFTKRIACSTEQTMIGGAEFYKPTCRFHHTN